MILSSTLSPARATNHAFSRKDSPSESSLLASGLSRAVQVEPTSRYEMRIAADGESLRMRACFAGEGLRELIPGEPFGRPFLRQIEEPRDKGGRRWRPSTQGIAFSSQDTPFCVDYDVDLAAASQSAGPRVAERIGSSLSVDPDLFLYRPPKTTSAHAATIEMCAPKDWSVSVPWPELQATDKSELRIRCDSREEKTLRFLLRPSVFSRRGRIFMGAFPQRRLRIRNTDFDVAFLEGTAMQGRGFDEWLRNSAFAVEQMYGAFPRERVQVSLRFAPGRGAHFGLVFRAGGIGAHFWLGENTRAKDLRHDWVGVHELSHLSLPFIRTSEPWLSEGVATYYQYLLQARAGWISESEFWYRLLGGIRSATAAPRDTLRKSAANMARTGDYRRVYWGGAVLVWLADVTLRVRSENSASLDRALERLLGCCLPSEQRWTAQALAQKLDELTDDSVFQHVFNAHLDQISPPPLEHLLRNLGIVYEGNEVQLRDDAPWAHIRRSIVTPVARKDEMRR